MVCGSVNGFARAVRRGIMRICFYCSVTGFARVAGRGS